MPQPTAAPVAWNVNKKTIAELAAELIRGAECMGDDETELALEIRMPGTVQDDDGNLNAVPVLAISYAEYPEEGVYPIDPHDPTAGREQEAQQQAQHHCKNCEGVQPETCGFNVKQQADDADAEWRRLALQFDGHRMQALAHLRGLLENPESHAEAVRAFLAAPPLSGEQVLANRIAEQALKPVSLTRDWPKIEAYVIDAAMRDYVESYEMIGDNNEVCYSPTKAEQALIIDCMRGLLAESDFIDMLTAQPPAQQQIVATQLVCDALVAVVSHSGDPAGTVAALAEWRKKAEAFTRNPAGQQQAEPVAPSFSMPNIEYVHGNPWVSLSTADGEETISVSIGRALWDEDGRAYVLAFVGEDERRMYFDGKPPAVAVPAQAAAIPDELTCEDIERLRLALSWEGYSTPESLEACAARWPSLVRDLIAGVLDRKKRTQAAAQKGGAQ